jgi:two-component system, LuxR family, response regulator FixJ
MAMEGEPIIFVVDDDPAARESVAAMVAARGMAAETYASAEEFLARFDRGRPGCLIVDLRMGGISGLELQRKLREEGILLPFIVITAYGDVPTAVAAMRTGALTFLEKPCSHEDLWESICRGLEEHRRQREAESRRLALAARRDALTPQEAQVMRMMLDGVPNKMIASQLGIGLRTVELRRARILKKMDVASLVDLVRIDLELRDHDPP